MSIYKQLSSQKGEKTEEGNRLVAMMCLEKSELLIMINEGLKSHDTGIIGDCAEVLTKVAEVDPIKVAPFVDSLISLLNHKTTRVRWEAMHAVALITTYKPDEISCHLGMVRELMHTDKSTIVRDYAVETLCEYAKLGREPAEVAFPMLKEALIVWEGKHRARALKGLQHVCSQSDRFTLEIRGIAEEYLEDSKGVVKKAAKTLVKMIDRS